MGTSDEPTTEGTAFLAALRAGLPGQGVFGPPLVVGVSGGADSVALLLGLHALAGAVARSGRLVIAHGRHDLREEAGADADFVAALAAELGLPCVIGTLRVRRSDGVRGEGLPTPSRRTLTAVILTSVRSEVSALSPSRLRWPPTPSRGHGQPLAPFFVVSQVVGWREGWDE